MRTILTSVLALALLAGGLLTVATGQPPEGKGKKGKKDAHPLVDRLMAFDKNKDGKLTKDELTDERLHRLLQMADTKKKGFVTREDLQALAAKLDDDDGPAGPGGFGKGGFGKGGFGKGGPGPDGPGGRGGPGRPPRPGTILPGFLVEELELTDAQKKKLGALQKEVDDKLAKILTGEQKEKLEELGKRGPGGPGGRGPGGPGGRRPGGPPPERD